MSTQIPGLFIMHDTIKGRCIYTALDIRKGDIIESAPVIVLPPKDLHLIHQSGLHDYYFLWGDDRKSCALALGYGSLYNHEQHPNTDYIFDFGDNSIEFFAIEDIAANSEITINYHGEPGDGNKLWF
jgi:SET domain-containing protein